MEYRVRRAKTVIQNTTRYIHCTTWSVEAGCGVKSSTKWQGAVEHKDAHRLPASVRTQTSTSAAQAGVSAIAFHNTFCTSIWPSLPAQSAALSPSRSL